MKYLLLVRVDEKKIEALSPNEAQQLDDDSLAYDDTLRKGGHLIAAQALQFSGDAAIVRVQKGKAVITDGPFVETKEQVGGFILIEADRGPQDERKNHGQIGLTTMLDHGLIEIL